MLQRVRIVLEWCKAQGFCSGDNPTDGVTKVLPKQRAARNHHPALPYRQLPTFINELKSSDSGEIVRLAFEFMIFSAARTSEVLNAAWSEIDRKGKMWTIPAARMKTGIDHRVPLSNR